MMECISRVIKKLDIFGQPIRLQMNGEETVRTNLGGSMTICLVILIGATFSIYSQDAFFKENPYIYTSTNYTEDSRGVISINHTYFRFNLGPEFMFSYNSTQIDTSPYLSINTSGHKISDCKNDDSNFETSPSYNGSILTNNWYCVDFTNSTERIEEFMFEISFCQGMSTCKSIDEINSFISPKDFGLNYILDGFTLDANNYKYPMKSQKKWYYSDMGPNYIFKNFVNFILHKLTTDDGLIYSNKQINKYTDGSGEYFAVFDDNSGQKILSNNCKDYPYYCNVLVTLAIQSYQKIITYERKYKRIADALANVGGMSSILMKTFTFLLNMYCTFIRNERIANHIYNFDSSYNEISNTNKKLFDIHLNQNNNLNLKISSHNLSLDKSHATKNSRKFPSTVKTIANARNIQSESKSNVKGSSILPENDSSNIISPQLAVKLIPLHKIHEKRYHKTYKYKFYHCIAYYLCCHNLNKESYLKKQYENNEKVKTAISSLLDIRRILNQTEEFDNLKMAILSNQQYALLNYITKQSITETINEGNNNDEIKSKYILDKNFLQKEENLRNLVNEVLTSVKQYGNSSNLDPITSKLVDYIDPEFLDNKEI